MAGTMKLAKSPEELAAGGIAFATQVPVSLVLFAGVVEVMGGLGLLLPSLTRISPKLTPLAALGMVITMIGAVVTEVAVGAPQKVAAPLVLLVLSAFVGWGRLVKHPIQSR